MLNFILRDQEKSKIPFAPSENDEEIITSEAMQGDTALIHKVNELHELRELREFANKSIA